MVTQNRLRWNLFSSAAALRIAAAVLQALIWLQEDASELKERILSWKQPLAYLKQYEQHGYPLRLVVPSMYG